MVSCWTCEKNISRLEKYGVGKGKSEIRKESTQLSLVVRIISSKTIINLMLHIEMTMVRSCF